MSLLSMPFYTKCFHSNRLNYHPSNTPVFHLFFFIERFNIVSELSIVMSKDINDVNLLFYYLSIPDVVYGYKSRKLCPANRPYKVP